MPWCILLMPSGGEQQGMSVLLWGYGRGLLSILCLPSDHEGIPVGSLVWSGIYFLIGSHVLNFQGNNESSSNDSCKDPLPTPWSSSKVMQG